MAIAVTQLGVTFNTTAGNKTVVATPAAADYIVIICGASGSNRSNSNTTSVTDNNADGLGTYSKAVQSNGTNVYSNSIWVRDQPIGSATSTTFTATQNSSSGGGLSVLKVTGVTRVGSDAFRQSAKGFDTSSTTPSLVFGNPTVTTNPIIAGIINDSVAPILTEPTGFTEIDDISYTTPTVGFETVSRNSGTAVTTLTWGSASATPWEGVSIEVDASAVPSVGPTSFNLPYKTSDDPNLVFTGKLYTPRSTRWGNGPWPAILVTESGGYNQGGNQVGNDTFQILSGDTTGSYDGQGFLVLFVDTRLYKATGQGGLSGQTTTGVYPQPMNDFAKAYAYLLNHPLCNGTVFFMGSSGGADVCLNMALMANNYGLRPPAAVVSLSGMMNAGDNADDVAGYPNFPVTTQNFYADTDLTKLQSQSCISKVTQNTFPIYFCHGTADPSMPYSVFTQFNTQMAAVGNLQYISHTNTSNGGILHGWGTFPENQVAIVNFLRKYASQTGGTSEGAPMGGGQPSFNERIASRGISVAGPQSYKPIIPSQARGRMAALSAKGNLTADEEEELDALRGIYG